MVGWLHLAHPPFFGKKGEFGCQSVSASPSLLYRQSVINAHRHARRVQNSTNVHFGKIQNVMSLAFCFHYSLLGLALNFNILTLGDFKTCWLAKKRGERKFGGRKTVTLQLSAFLAQVATYILPYGFGGKNNNPFFSKALWENRVRGRHGAAAA